MEGEKVIHHIYNYIMIFQKIIQSFRMEKVSNKNEIELTRNFFNLKKRCRLQQIFFFFSSSTM